MSVAVRRPLLAAIFALLLAPAARPAAAPGAPDVLVDSLGQRLVLVPAGSFRMGSPPGEPLRQDEETVRRVTLTRPFRIAATEVTRRQWLALMPPGPSAPSADDRPVTSVSWADAQEFCRRLSEKEGAVYRLPTEAEWEHACRAGAETPPSRAELAELAWFAENADGAAQAVAGKRPNAWGLHDTLGNAAEWTQDVYAPYPRVEAETDPTGPAAGTTRVVRGGAFRSFAPALRCAARAGAPASYQLPHVGFRVVREAGEERPGLRVMTFNIRFDNPADGEDAWPRRREKAASMIRFHGADVVGLQEALPGQIADLEAMLPGFSWFGAGRSAERDGEHCAVLYRRDRLEVLEQSTFWLSETPEVPGSRSWDAALPRIATWGRLRDRRTGAVLHLFNTHLDHRGEQARRESAQLLLRKIAEIAPPDEPVVVTGDLNATPDSEPYRLLTAPAGPGAQVALVDAILASQSPHHGPTSTWNGFRAIEPLRRIDFVLVRPGVGVARHGILSDTFDGRFPSDHLPVLAEIVLPGAAR
jgi:formylglycine-generating enzyme required for sulfatase activity/endonuclease/exonuclease/phosphatase family metal-dependent hydrolase